MTSKNIAEVHNANRMITYKAICGCTGDEDIHTLILECDRKFQLITLTLYANTSYDFWMENSPWYYWPKNVWRRIKKALILIFTGYIKQESSFLFQDKKTIEDYINALKEGIEYLEGKKNERQ